VRSKDVFDCTNITNLFRGRSPLIVRRLQTPSHCRPVRQQQQAPLTMFDRTALQDGHPSDALILKPCKFAVKCGL